jgi:hypothetical protein
MYTSHSCNTAQHGTPPETRWGGSRVADRAAGRRGGSCRRTRCRRRGVHALPGPVAPGRRPATAASRGTLSPLPPPPQMVPGGISRQRRSVCSGPSLILGPGPWPAAAAVLPEPPGAHPKFGASILPNRSHSAHSRPADRARRVPPHRRSDRPFGEDLSGSRNRLAGSAGTSATPRPPVAAVRRLVSLRPGGAGRRGRPCAQTKTALGGPVPPRGIPVPPRGIGAVGESAAAATATSPAAAD